VVTRSAESLERYCAKADPIISLVALVMVLLFAIQSSDTTSKLPRWAFGLIVALYVVLILDVVARLRRAPDRWAYVRRHPIEVGSVVLPIFRILLVGRLLGILSRRGARLADRATAYALYLTSLVVVFGALLAVDAERGAPGATILNFGDGVWWAIVTVATVGYGDVVPVTELGRLIGVVLIVTSVGLLAIVTANISSRFVAARTAESAVQGMDERLERIEASLARLVVDVSPEGPASTPTTDRTGS
jgi:voltage-gated potassium channel